MKKALLVVCLAFAANSFSLTQWSNRLTNFFDDTVNVSYKAGTSGSATMGVTKVHQESPEMALWSTMFYKVKPGDAITTSHARIILEEVDINPITLDTVYTLVGDTAVDTITTTSVVADTSWVKYAFAPNPANGYRWSVSGASGCSATTASTMKIWLHSRKKIGTFGN